MWVVAARRPRWGEVWAFCDPDGRILVHRYVGRRQGSYRFWGDANAAADPNIDADALIGRVVELRDPHGRVQRVGTTDRFVRGVSVGVRRTCRRARRRLRPLLARIRGSHAAS